MPRFIKPDRHRRKPQEERNTLLVGYNGQVVRAIFRVRLPDETEPQLRAYLLELQKLGVDQDVPLLSGKRVKLSSLELGTSDSQPHPHCLLILRSLHTATRAA